MKSLKTLLLFFLLILAGWWLLSKIGAVPSLRNLFKEQPVTISQTGVYIREIKALSQLVTVSAYDELVADSVKTLLPNAFRLPAVFPPLGLPRRLLGERRLVLVGKTATHVGINMQQMAENSITVVKDSIHITLPKAQVLDVVLNPSGVEVFIEEGEWKQEALAALKNKLRSQAAAKAVAKGLLPQAEAKAATVFTAFFKSAGFKKVTIAFG